MKTPYEKERERKIVTLDTFHMYITLLFVLTIPNQAIICDHLILDIQFIVEKDKLSLA